MVSGIVLFGISSVNYRSFVRMRPRLSPSLYLWQIRGHEGEFKGNVPVKGKVHPSPPAKKMTKPNITPVFKHFMNRPVAQSLGFSELVITEA